MSHTQFIIYKTDTYIRTYVHTWIDRYTHTQYIRYICACTAPGTTTWVTFNMIAALKAIRNTEKEKLFNTLGLKIYQKQKCDHTQSVLFDYDWFPSFRFHETSAAPFIQLPYCWKDAVLPPDSCVCRLQGQSCRRVALHTNIDTTIQTPTTLSCRAALCHWPSGKTIYFCRVKQLFQEGSRMLFWIQWNQDSVPAHSALHQALTAWINQLW